MKASLVICTRDRALRLSRCLDALDKLDRNGVELVFVDNASVDHTSQVLLEWAATRPNVRVIHEPAPGLGRARNTGWKATTSEVVVFTDDDCYPVPDYVQQHIRLYEDNPRLGWATGKILLFDPNDAKITIQENPYTVHSPAHKFLPPGAVHGANFSFRKTALQTIDGFDPLMGAGSVFSCEDLDAAARASFAGFEGLYSPRPVVYHHHGRQTAEEVGKLEASYRKGRGAYYAKAISIPGMRREYILHALRNWRRQPWSEIREEMKAMWLWCRIGGRS